MFLLKRKYRPLLGLDITTSSVKLIELAESGGQYRVEAYAAEPTPQNAINEKAVVDAEAVACCCGRVWVARARRCWPHRAAGREGARRALARRRLTAVGRVIRPHGGSGEKRCWSASEAGRLEPAAKVGRLEVVETVTDKSPESSE